MCKIKYNEDSINDLVDKWHESDSNLPLYEYLGMTFQEYKDWVELKTIKNS